MAASWPGDRAESLRERVNAPLMATVAVRSGPELSADLADAGARAVWMVRDTARALNTMVRWASMASLVRTNMGGPPDRLGHAEGLLDAPQVVVVVDHVAATGANLDIGDITLQPPPATCPIERGFIERARSGHHFTNRGARAAHQRPRSHAPA